MKIVCDTNVIVSGILFGGHSREILSLVARGELLNFTSQNLLHELQEVLGRPKFGLDPDQVNLQISLARDTFRIIHARKKILVVTADPDDDEVITVAIAANADYIISGDKHLRDLGKWDQTSIVSPASFIKAIGGQ